MPAWEDLGYSTEPKERVVDPFEESDVVNEHIKQRNFYYGRMEVNPADEITSNWKRLEAQFPKNGTLKLVNLDNGKYVCAKAVEPRVYIIKFKNMTVRIEFDINGTPNYSKLEEATV